MTNEPATTADGFAFTGADLDIRHGHLVVRADGCTCDGTLEHGHRDYCGWEPVMSVDELADLLNTELSPHVDEPADRWVARLLMPGEKVYAADSVRAGGPVRASAQATVHPAELAVYSAMAECATVEPTDPPGEHVRVMASWAPAAGVIVTLPPLPAEPGWHVDSVLLRRGRVVVEPGDGGRYAAHDHELAKVHRILDEPTITAERILPTSPPDG